MVFSFNITEKPSILFCEYKNCKEISINVFPEKKLRGLCPHFHIHVSVSDLYIPPSVRLVWVFSCGRIGRPIVGIYKSPIEHKCRNWRSSCSGNICLEFSVLCLCSMVNTNSGLQTTYRRTDRYLRYLHYFGYPTF